jgi:hypothetical protein
MLVLEMLSYDYSLDEGHVQATLVQVARAFRPYDDLDDALPNPCRL